MDNLVPGAFATADGIPPHCAQLLVWNYWNRLHPEPDHIAAYFLIDSKDSHILIDQPPFDGKWRILRQGRCDYACWRSRPDSDGKIVRHKLQNEVWLLAGRTIPPGYFVGFANRDFYDCQLSNLVLIPIVAPTTRRIDHSLDPVPCRVR